MLYRCTVRLAVIALMLSIPTVGRLGSVATAAPARQATTVDAGDNFFEPRNVTVRAGTTVQWTNMGQNPHTVTADNGAFNSGNLNSGQGFSFTFSTAGTYPYYCEYHGSRGGQGMAGTITVTAAEAAAPTPAQPAAQAPAAPAQPAAQPAAPAQPAAQPAPQAPPQQTMPATGNTGSGSVAILALALISAMFGLVLRLRGKRYAG